MSNHKGHLIGGCIAYGITLAVTLLYSCLFENFKIIFVKEQTLLASLPTMLANIEYSIHYYFPILITALTWLFSNCWPFLLIGIEWFLCTLAGAMFPDVDIKSTSQKYLYSVVFLSLLALIGQKKFYTASFIGILSVVPVFSNHRGLFHRTWFVILLPLITWLWINQVFPGYGSLLFIDTLFFIAGALSHLWLDMGIKMFRFRL